MFEKINAFQLASSMARHANERQSVIARNIANADTPGYRAMDITPFTAQFERSGPAANGLFDALARAGLPTRPPELLAGAKPTLATRPAESFGTPRTTDAPDETSPNGNTVSLESQMVKSTVASRQHDMALAVYKHALSFIRTSIGRPS